MKKTVLFFLMLFSVRAAEGRKPPSGPRSAEWPGVFETVEIKPSERGFRHRAVFRRAESPGPRPLIVSLNAWAGDPAGEPFIAEIVARDYHYIRPGLRGEAGMADAKNLSDVYDALHYALRHAEVDSLGIRLIGPELFRSYAVLSPYGPVVLESSQTSPGRWRDNLSFLGISDRIEGQPNLLVLGDSFSAYPGGWGDMLRENLPGSDILNISRGGRTIGFDNNGREDLNALKNIDSYLLEAAGHIGEGSFDYVLLCLGTNDAKAEYAGREDEVVENFRNLTGRIAAADRIADGHTRFVFITPPPMGTEGMEAKYEGGNERLGRLVPRLAEEARRAGFEVIDVYHPLQGVFRNYAPDGVHMEPEGQKIIAGRVSRMIGWWEAQR